MAEPVPLPRDLQGHVVVCGLDHLGLRTVEELHLRDEQVVVIAAPDDHAIDEERLRSTPILRGDQRFERVLRAAGVDRASAIVLTADDDLGNLHAALAAHEMNPNIQIVMRLFDAEMGAHVPTLLGNAVALSSSALAQPGFVSAALDGESGGSFVLAGRVFTSRSIEPAAGSGASPASVGSTATARPDPPPDQGAPHTDVIPIARLRPDRSVELLPDADPGEPGLIVVEARDLGEGQLEVARPSSRPRRSRWMGIAHLRDGIASPDRRLVNLAAVILGLAAISAVFFGFVTQISPVDALSYAFSLLTGAGSGVSNVDVATAPAALKVYVILLSLCGAAIIGVVYALITDAVIGSRLLRTLGRRTVPTSIHDHVIVCGLGAVGYRVALGVLERGVPVVAVEIKEGGRFVSAARSRGIPVITADARQPETLRELGIARARAVVAATNNDLVNIATALNARATRPGMRVVVRVFDPDFALRVQRGFKIRFTRSVSHLAAPAFAAAALGSEVVATVPVGDRRVILFARVRVPPGSALQTRTIGSLDGAGERRILGTVGPDAAAAHWHPPADAVLRPDEDLLVAATRAGLASLLDLARAARAQA